MATKGKIVGIVAWGVAGAMALVAAGLGAWGARQSGRAAERADHLGRVAAAAGMEEVEWAELAERIGAALEECQSAIVAAESSLAAARGEAAAARSEASAQAARMQELTAQVDSLSKNLAARGEELASSAAALKQAAEAAEQAALAAEEERTRLERLVERRTAEAARLQAEVNMLRLPESIAMQMEADDGDDENGTNGAAPAVGVEPEPEEDLEAGQVIGMSQMFSHVRYDENQTLRFRLLDGQRLFYENVPRSVVDQFVRSRDTLDITYLRRIQGAFKSVPPDNVVVRKYWKWHRRHKAKSEVRFVEPPLEVQVVVPQAQ